MSPRGKSKTEPQILEIPPQKMAVVYVKGAPDKVFPKVMPALYGSVYTLKFDLKKRGEVTFKVSGLRARYPDAALVPKEEWTIILGLPIPEDTVALPQKENAVAVKIETWEYGRVAQVLYLGPYDQEGPAIAGLLRFIEKKGYEIAGAHEEEYLTRSDAKVPKTIIRYPIRERE